MMRLADEVREQIQAFIDGRLQSRELQGWLDSVADEVHADRDGTVRQLTGEVYVVLAELGYGDRTIESAVGELMRLLTESRGPHINEAAPTIRRIPRTG
jgi:hypothetical protein